MADEADAWDPAYVAPADTSTAETAGDADTNAETDATGTDEETDTEGEGSYEGEPNGDGEGDEDPEDEDPDDGDADSPADVPGATEPVAEPLADAQRQIAELRAQIAAVAEIPPLDLSPDPNDPEPDAEEDPMAHLQWQGRQTTRMQQAIVAHSRLTTLASREAAQAAKEGPAWNERLAFFQDIVAIVPGAYDQVFTSKDPTAAMVALTNRLRFKPSQPATPATPKPNNQPTTSTKQKAPPKMLSGVAGARGEDPGTSDGRGYSDEAWERIPQARRDKMLGKP